MASRSPSRAGSKATTASARAGLREPGGPRPFYLHDNFRWGETLSANGTFVTLEGKETFTEIKATHIEGAIYEFQGQLTGHVVAYDADGAVLGRDRGLIRWTVVFDKSESPTAPGGELIEFIDVKVAGPHPLTDVPLEEFCALFE